MKLFPVSKFRSIIPSRILPGFALLFLILLSVPEIKGNHLPKLMGPASYNGPLSINRIPVHLNSFPAFSNTLTTYQMLNSIWFKVFLGILIVALVYFVIHIWFFTLKRKQVEFEEQINLRTHELVKINANLIEEIKMRKEAEERLMKQTEQLKEMNLAKDKFFSIISHDLKSPFQGLLGFTEMITEDFDSMSDEQRKNIIKEIRNTSLHIYNLLINVLEWSRLQTHRIDFLPEKIVLRDEVEAVKNLLLINSSSKNISIHNEVAVDCHVFADPNMLRSVLHNLLSNAVKFTRQDGYVKVRASLAGNFYVVNVIDNGIGISQEDIGKIFSIGIQYSTKGTANEQGTGLGLTLCKEMIERHGGSIWVESTPGTGSSFRFTLPRFRSQSSDQAQPLDLFSA